MRRALAGAGFLSAMVVLFLVGFYFIGPALHGAGAPQSSPQSELTTDGKWGQAPVPPRPAARPKPPTPADKPAVEVEEIPADAQASESPDSDIVSETEGPTPESPAPETRPAASPPDARRPSPELEVSVSQPRRYYVQAGVYGSRANAQTVVTGLADQGYGAAIRQIVREGVTRYQVVVGNAKSKSEADRLAAELRNAGTDVIVTPVE